MKPSSSESVEIVRRSFDAWNAGDMERFLALHTDDVEVRTDPEFAEAGTFVGREEARRWWEGIRAAWEGGGVALPGESEELSGRVLVRCRWGGRGEESGMETYLEVSCIFTLRSGRISRVEYHFDHEAALEALGTGP